MKKQFSIPRVVPAVFLMETEVPGHGSDQEDQNKFKPVPMSFAEWTQSRWVADYDNSGNVTVDDYAKWWSQAGLGDAAWAQFNAGSTLDK